jgi:hypothetical protein
VRGSRSWVEPTGRSSTQLHAGCDNHCHDCRSN